MCCVIDKQMEVNEQTSLLSSSSSSTHKQKQELIDSSSTQSSSSESSSSSGSSSSSTFFEIYHQYTNTSSDRTNGHDNNDGHDDDHHHHHHDQPPEDDATPSTTTGSSSSINYSTNILLAYRLQELKSVSQINLWLSIFCLIYLGINVCLICANYVNYQYEQTHKNDTDYDEEDEQPVNDIVYHMTEFWATFCFAVIKYLAIVNTPKAIITSASSSSAAGTQQRSSGGKMISNPMFLRIVMFIDIVATITPAVMISFSVNTFEIPSHEIEYTNSLIMTFIDIIIAGSLWNNSSTIFSSSKSTISSKSSNKSKDNHNNNNNNISTTTTRTTDGKISMGIVTLVALVVAIIQLGVYNLMGYDEETGEMK